MTQYEPCRPLRLAGSELLVVPRVKTKRGEAAFSFYVAQMWNTLQEDLRLETMLTIFKSKLKADLFTIALNEFSFK